MPQFILLLHEEPCGLGDLSPEEIQAVIARYSAWRERVAADGHMVDGHKLTDEGGRHLAREGGSVRVVDGPFSEAKEIIGGLFIIKAADYDQAVEICRSCPHLDNGWIELRQIDEV